MDRQSESRARIEEIKRRKAQRERELRRRKYMIRRIFLLLILIAVIAAVVFGVKSCVGKISERRAEKTDERDVSVETQTPDPNAISGVSGNTLTDRLSKSDVDQRFYSGSVFFGNSFVDGMEIYELVDDAEYIGKVGLSVNDALEGDSDGDALVDRLADGSYGKIFMMFGENELGWSTTETFEDKYIALINAVKEYQPSAQIYLLSITPVSKEVSDAAEDGTTRENIIAFNKMIRSVAQKANVNFADIFNGLAVDGYLPDGVAADGVHFGEDYYIKCLVNIQNAFGRSSSTGAGGSPTPTGAPSRDSANTNGNGEKNKNENI